MDLGCGITFDIFTHVFTRVVLNLLIKKNIQVDDLDEGYNVVTSYKKNTWKQSVKINRDVVKICCFKVSYKKITWKQSVKINRDVVEICCFKEKNGSKHASCVYCSKPKGRSKLEPDSDESVSSATTWLGCFSSDDEVDALDVEACSSLVFGFFVACWL